MRIRWQIWTGWIPALIWMGLIFCGSTRVLSAQHTSRFIEPLLRWICHGRLSQPQIVEVHYFIRKLGHLAEYSILAVLLWNALRGSVSAPARRSGALYAWTLILAGLYASSDEFHQSFVPTRGASVHDVLLDLVGASAGLLILHGCRRLRRHWGSERPHPDRS